MNSIPAQTQWATVVANEYRRRFRLAALTRSDPAARAAIIAYLSQDTPEALIAFAKDWVMTHDPRNADPLPKSLPFIPWQRQEELLRALWQTEQDKENLVVEKSRDTGVTVLVIGVYYVWRWLFTPGFVGGVGSRKADLLDRKDDPSTAFAKIRRTIYSLPKWMLPVGFDQRIHDNHTRIINPENGASIMGESGDNQGRGGRSTRYALDEAGKMQRPGDIEAAVAGNTDSVVYMSTATPVGTWFHELATSGRAQLFRFHWKDDPRKDQAWYDKFQRKYGPVITALEVDIDYGGASSHSFIPYHYVMAAVDNYDPAMTLNPDWTRAAGFDPAAGGSADHAYIARCGPMLIALEAWGDGDPSEACAPVAGYIRRDGVKQFRFDSIGVGAGVGTTISGFNLSGVSVDGVNVGIAPDYGFLDDNDEQSCKDRFNNLKAQLWWSLRLRFENTYRRFILAEDIPVEQCIFIPEDSTLITQLVAPKMVTAANGKVAVESKESMARRGVPSPDRADALVLAFAEQVASNRHTVTTGGRVREVGNPNVHARNRLSSIATGRSRL